MAAYAVSVRPGGIGWSVEGWAATLRDRPRVVVWTDDWLRDDFRALIALYAFADFQGVQTFLRLHDDAVPLLLEGYTRLMEAFGDRAQPVLRIEDDPGEEGEANCG